MVLPLYDERARKRVSQPYVQEPSMICASGPPRRRRPPPAAADYDSSMTLVRQARAACPRGK
jgi:hypothetical protein